MNRCAMIKPKFKIVLAATCAAATLSLPACDTGHGAVSSVDQTEGVVLEGSTIGGDFELTSSKGETVRWTDFEGKYRIVYFGYAYCPDICPYDVQKIALAHKQFSEDNPELGKQIQPIFITIDPERDTQEVVGQFASRFSDSMIGLTGTAEQIKQAADAFSVVYGKAGAEDGTEPTENDEVAASEVPSDSYLMNHTNLVYLMGKQGEPLVALPVDLGPEAMVRDMQRWIK